MALTGPDMAAYYARKGTTLKQDAGKLYASDMAALATVGYKADLPLANLYGRKLTIRHTQAESVEDKNAKLNGLTMGFRLVAAYNRSYVDTTLPDFEVIFTPKTVQLPSGEKQKVLNAAHHVNARGEAKITLVLTSSALEVNDFVRVPFADAPALEQGTTGDRGVPDRFADLPANRQQKVTARVAATVVHEIGHMLHCLREPAKFWAQIGGGKADPQDDYAYKITRANKEKVSMYSANNASINEYVAEVFTMLVTGETVSPAMLSDYTDAGGPP